MTPPATDPEANRRARVFVVDDVPANLGVLLTCLDDAGYEVLVASSGDKALARLDQVQPDLILLDVNMPGIDGYETCRRLKADARWREVPVLFLTALGEPVDKMQGFAVGAADYITKPLHTGEVLARVRAHLRIRAFQQTLEEKNALLEAAMAWRLEAEAQLQQGLGQAVIVVDPQGTVSFCSRLARRLLERYFADHADADTLPAPLTRWLGDGVATGSWQPGSAESRLDVQRFSSGQPGAPLMLLLEERVLAAHSPARLLALGLTAREAEVLYWAAHGKSNAEVAAILSTAPGTVKKQMASILYKTGSDTRLIAALRAAELLELGHTDAARASRDA